MRTLVLLLVLLCSCEMQPHPTYTITAYDADTDKVVRVFKNRDHWSRVMDNVRTENFYGKRWNGTYWIDGIFWTPKPLMRSLRFEVVKNG